MQIGRHAAAAALMLVLSASGTAASAPGAANEQVLAALERSAEGLPGDGDLKLGEARMLLDTGRLQEALAAMQEAIQLSPQQSLYFVLLGRIHLMRGMIPEAQLAYSEAARLDPGNAEALALATSLTRKAGVVAYAQGVEAFNRKAWGRARRLLTQALALGNLPAEHSAIAQQDLIIAHFAEARVQDSIKQVQEARVAASRDYLARRISVADADAYPSTNGPGNAVSFIGRVVERRDGPASNTSELIVTMRDSGFRSREVGSASGWFSVVTPTPLPSDPRVARGALVEVRGHLIESSSRGYGATASRVAVKADWLDFSLDQAGRGLAGPLRIDYLSYTEEQRQNLPAGERQTRIDPDRGTSPAR